MTIVVASFSFASKFKQKPSWQGKYFPFSFLILLYEKFFMESHSSDSAFLDHDSFSHVSCGRRKLYPPTTLIPQWPNPCQPAYLTLLSTWLSFQVGQQVGKGVDRERNCCYLIFSHFKSKLSSPFPFEMFCGSFRNIGNSLWRSCTNSEGHLLSNPISCKISKKTHDYEKDTLTKTNTSNLIWHWVSYHH